MEVGVNVCLSILIQTDHNEDGEPEPLSRSLSDDREDSKESLGLL